jgi:hypothetical protein
VGILSFKKERMSCEFNEETGIGTCKVFDKDGKEVTIELIPQGDGYTIGRSFNNLSEDSLRFINKMLKMLKG